MRILIFAAGAILSLTTMASAIRIFVLPRSARDPIARVVFGFVRFCFDLLIRRTKSYARRDQIMAFYAPIGLLSLLPAWLNLVALGYTAMFWASGIDSWRDAFTISGSSLLTLGFSRGDTLLQTILSFSEATIGLILVALLIAYLPTMYSAFSRREMTVTLLEVRAGNPPSSIEMLLRYNRIHGLNRLHDSWERWESWFADLEESHTSLPALVFFRSPQAEHSWVSTAGAILDSAALYLAVIDIPWDAQAALCIRAGYLALARIATFFNINYNSDPRFPDDPISITRQQFDEACAQLIKGNIPLKEDREQAWQDFGGWRVNYDTTLRALCRLTMAPQTPWVCEESDEGQQLLKTPVG